LFPRIVMFEDEADLRSAYVERLQEQGFDDVHAFSDTDGMLSRIKELYTRPAVLLTDWYISPLPPTTFVPELRRAGIPIPVVIMTSRGRFELLSGLNASCGLAGWFAKGTDPDTLIAKLASTLMDLTPSAGVAWEEYCAGQEARALVRHYRPEQAQTMRRLLGFALPKELIGDDESGLSKDMVYKVRGDMIDFMRKGSNPTTRFVALMRVLDAAAM